MTGAVSAVSSVRALIINLLLAAIEQGRGAVYCLRYALGLILALLIRRAPQSARIP
jgi:hypothetical protein